MKIKKKLGKIRVMHIVNSLGIGGMETVLAEMLKMYDRSSFITYVCCMGREGELVNDLREAGIEVFFVTKNNTFDFFRIFKLADLLAEKKIDIVHSYSGVYRDGTIAAKLAGVPVILHTDQGKIYPDKLMTRIYHCFLTNLFRHRVTAVSEDLKNYLIKKIRINPSKVVVIYNGIKLGKTHLRFDKKTYKRNIGLSEDDLVFGIVARLAPVKDHATLLEAAVMVFKNIANAKLLVIGDGPLRDELRDRAQALGIADRVIFLGKRRDIPELLSILDIFVLSSLHEGLSLSILEAMSHALPVVATNVGGNPEVVVNNVTGLLTEPRNPILLAGAITELLKDKEKRIRLGTEGKIRVEEKFDLNKIVKQYENLYTSHFLRHSGAVKIMHLASNPEWAGAEVHLATLVNSLKDDKRIDVSVCVFHDGKLVDSLQERGIKVNVIPLKWIFDISVIFKLARIMRDEKTEILHTHGYKANVIGALAAVLAGHTVCIRTEHGLTEPFRGFDRLKMSFYICLDYLTAKLLTKKIIAVSRDIQQKSMTKYPKDKVKTIHNGIDIASNEVSGGEKLKKILGIKADGLIVGTVGRLVPVKGHEYFINAAKLILKKRQDVHFLIVGDGPLKAYLESKVLESNLGGHITFTGFRNDVKDIIGLIDIIVFPSLSEGIPYALLEAMAARKAVIATRTGGLTEVILDGQNGWLIEIANEKELAEKCLYLLENQDVIKNIGENAEKTVKENFSAEAMKEETIKVYEESLAV